MKYFACIVLGIFIGYYFTKNAINKYAKETAQKELMKTELGSKLKTAHLIDSLNKGMIDQAVKEDIKLRNRLLELASKHKDYNAEGLAKEIIIIITDTNKE